MTKTLKRRLAVGLTTLLLLAGTIISPLRVWAATFTISENGPYVAIDSGLQVPSGEWRLNTSARLTSNSNGTAANASLIFGYVDAAHYYYANYAAASGVGLSGVYRVANGVRTTLATYNNTLATTQNYTLEVRYKDNVAKVYLGTSLLYKVSANLTGTKLGVATVAGNASFTNTAFELGSTSTALNLALEGDTPPPVASPPTVSMTTPVANATVSGMQALSATASDAQAVSMVQFLLDGSPVSAPNTTAPYAINWDTTTASNGAHVLSALATNQAGVTATSSPVNVTVANSVIPPVGAGFSITEIGDNAGIDPQRSTNGSNDWRLSATITAQNGSTGALANGSLIFGYQNSENYYYLNVAAGSDAGLNGVYRVTNGIAYRLLSYSPQLTAGQPVGVEVRYRDNSVRLYVNGAYVTKAEGIALSGTATGVATLGGTAATFANPTLKIGSASFALGLVATNVTATPEDPYACVATPVTPARTESYGRQVAVATAAELKAALLDAQPGDTITMADGVYADTMTAGNYNASFAVTADGTAAAPITLIGSREAVIDGDGTGGRYGLYFYGADYWNLVGFTVANASKGIVMDRSNHAFLEGVKVYNVGQEAVHFRAFSSDNVIINSVIDGTGKNSPQFGEGVYIGSANGNWTVHTDGQPDTSDRNVVIGNTFTDFAAEAIDIKEGSTGHYIAGNNFEGSSISGQNSADSWVDVKGNCVLLENNSGVNTLLDGYQVHNVYPGWGAHNVFRHNTATVNASGYGLTIDFNSRNLGNIIECNNTVTAAGAGPWNVACRP